MSDDGIRIDRISPEQFAEAMAKLRARSSSLGRGLPLGREDLHGLVEQLVNRVAAAGKRGISGQRLAEDLGLSGDRALRLLCAFARVAYGIGEIVGIPGSGYYWGPADPDVYKRMGRHARRMGRDWMFIGSLYHEGGAAGQMAQMLLEFASTAHQKAALGLVGEKALADDQADDQAGDDLADLADREGVTMGQVLDKCLGFMASHPDVYGADLRMLGDRHGDLLISAGRIRDLTARLERVAGEFREISGKSKL